MGAERLTSRSWVVLSALVVACRGPELAAPRTGPPPPRHMQVVAAMKTPQRRELVERFRKRNSDGGTDWTVNEDALGASLTVIDPFASFLRRARGKRSSHAPSAAPLGDDQARTSARAFVRRNADLLGIPRHVVVGLGERVRGVEAADHASPNARYAVRFEGGFPTKGYEAFHELDNTVDLEVFVDDDGQPSSFVNVSRVRPPLMFDTRPALARDSAALVAKVVGRTVFAVLDESGTVGTGPEDVRDLPRIPLGKVEPGDVLGARLVIHEATGPGLAWLAYRLAYAVDVGKSAPAAFEGEATSPVFFFRFVVDADTGDVLEDARVPVTPGAFED